MKKFKYLVTAFLMTMMLTFPAYATSFDISPSRPDIPVVDELPDPNAPDSPETVVITDGDVPRTYMKYKNPDGSYIYILEEEIPLASLNARVASPQTGENNGAVVCAAVAAGLGAMVLLTADRKKKA